MIQANELRVGNYIRNEVQGINFQVDSVVIHRLCFGDSEGYSPIELTEEILFKCGFYKSFKNQYEHTKHYFELVKEKEGFIVGVNCFEYTHGKHFMHLNTLQNIFYFTTNEELNVNL